MFMIRIVATTLLALQVSVGASYEINSASRFALTVEKTGLYRGKQHLFLFQKFEGQMMFDNAKPEESKIHLTIDSRSLVCKDDWVSVDDLKNIERTALEDMLAANRYPVMTFDSTSVRKIGSDQYEVLGTLAIRDIARPVTVHVHLDAVHSGTVQLEGRSVIRLSDYKLKPPSALLGAIGTKNEMTLNFKLSLDKL